MPAPFAFPNTRLQHHRHMHPVDYSVQNFIDKAISPTLPFEQGGDTDDDTEVESRLLFDWLTKDSLQNILRMTSRHPFSSDWKRGVELDTIEGLLQVPGSLSETPVMRPHARSARDRRHVPVQGRHHRHLYPLPPPPPP